MLFVKEEISLNELKKISEKMYENLVKAVVDISREVMVVDAEFHSDEEELLLEDGSEQANLWGINLYPDNIDNEKWIEFDSMINIRPYANNRSRYVEDSKIRARITAIVNKLVKK